MTREETKLILATIAEVYPKNLMTAVTKQTVDIWAQMIEDMEYKKVTVALARWIQTQKFPPTIADIREMANINIEQSRPTAEQAWGRLQETIRKCGYTMPKEAREMVGEEVWTIIQRFGYSHFCQMPVDESSTYFAHFRNAYNTEGKQVAEQNRLSPKVKAALESFKQAQLGDGHDNKY